MRNCNGVCRQEDLDQLCKWSITSPSAMTMSLSSASAVATMASGQSAVLATKKNIKATMMEQTEEEEQTSAQEFS